MPKRKKQKGPSLQQLLFIGGFLALTVLAGFRIYGLIGELREIKTLRAEREAQHLELGDRHGVLADEAGFLSDPDNLEKELRTRHNFRSPDEKLIIIVPPEQQATSTTSTQP